MERKGKDGGEGGREGEISRVTQKPNELLRVFNEKKIEALPPPFPFFEFDAKKNEAALKALELSSFFFFLLSRKVFFLKGGVKEERRNKKKIDFSLIFHLPSVLNLESSMLHLLIFFF